MHREKKVWKQNLQSHLHPSNTELTSEEHSARSSSLFLQAGFHSLADSCWAEHVCMHVAAGWACTDLATTNSLPPLPAQLLVGKPIRFNTAKKRKVHFFLRQSVPQPRMDRSWNTLLAVQDKGWWENEKQQQRVVGVPKVAMPGIRNLFTRAPFHFHPSAPIYNLSCLHILPTLTWHQRCFYSLHVFAQSHYGHTSNYYVTLHLVHSFRLTIFLPRGFI